MTMNFASFKPHPALADYVECYGLFQKEEQIKPGRSTNPPLPSQSIMFWYYDRPVYLSNGLHINGLAPKASIVPLATRGYTSQAEGAFQIFAIQFKPSQMRHFIALPWINILDDFLHISDIEDRELNDWALRIQESQDMKRNVELCDQFLLRRIPRQQPQLDLADHGLSMMFRTPWKKAWEISRELGISERHLRRVWTEQHGLSPAQYIKLIRFSKAIAQLNSGQFTSLSSLAHQWGYSDHSHFLKTFKHYTQTSLRNYLRQSHVMKLVGWREQYLDHRYLLEPSESIES